MRDDFGVWAMTSDPCASGGGITGIIRPDRARGEKADRTRIIRALDLFAGGGGSGHGARMAGVRVVAAVDSWDLACETYRDNFRSTNLYRRSARKRRSSPASPMAPYGSHSSRNWTQRISKGGASRA